MLYLENPALDVGFQNAYSYGGNKKTPSDIVKDVVWQLHFNIRKRTFKMNDVHILSHTKWNCKYHIVFAPKYRRKVFYEEKRLEVGAILR